MKKREFTESGALEGCVDGYNRGAVKGWVWYPARPDLAVTVEVLIDGEVYFDRMRLGLGTTHFKEGE